LRKIFFGKISAFVNFYFLLPNTAIQLGCAKLFHAFLLTYSYTLSVHTNKGHNVNLQKIHTNIHGLWNRLMPRGEEKKTYVANEIVRMGGKKTCVTNGIVRMGTHPILLMGFQFFFK
jgi:hypothetical protein